MQSALDDAVAKLAERDAEINRLRNAIEVERFLTNPNWSNGHLNEVALPGGFVEVTPRSTE